MRLWTEEAGWVRKHWRGVRLGEAGAREDLQEDLGVLAGQVRADRVVLGGLVAEVAKAVDHLLRRAAADPELQPATRDEVRGAGVLGHVERVLIAHVDDRRPDLDPLRARANRGQQRERRRELLGEVV